MSKALLECGEVRGDRLARLSQFLIEQILDTGLEPVEPPPLPSPITPEDIELLCWMGIEAVDGGSATGVK